MRNPFKRKIVDPTVNYRLFVEESETLLREFFDADPDAHGSELSFLCGTTGTKFTVICDMVFPGDFAVGLYVVVMTRDEKTLFLVVDIFAEVATTPLSRSALRSGIQWACYRINGVLQSESWA